MLEYEICGFNQILIDCYMTDSEKTVYAAHLKYEESSHNLIVQTISDHSTGTALLAEEFAPEALKGLVAAAATWHDIGKYQNEFQTYLRALYQANTGDQIKRVVHAGLGAVHAMQTCNDSLFDSLFGCMVAYLIAGHHAGLPDWNNPQTNRGLKYTLATCAEAYVAIKNQLPENYFAAKTDDHNLSSLLKRMGENKSPTGLSLALRIAFSCLVDADFLDTETFMEHGRSVQRKSRHEKLPEIEDLLHAFDEYMRRFESVPETKVNQIRRQIKEDVERGADLDRQFFSLTVPTGGGKTLDSLCFGLLYAAKHHKKRIIYAVPYTSIIEQTAAVFRKIFDRYPQAVLEHHSGIATDLAENDEQQDQLKLMYLAVENWDAPIIVTTNVQLFESLFAARTSRCRKLHNICDSVIILDEAQQLPRPFHAPIISIMKDMAAYFGTTWVLCTATQPALGVEFDLYGRVLKQGLPQPYELMPDPDQLFTKLQRAHIDIDLEPCSLSDVALHMKRENCVLCIVNTRRKAAELYNLLSDCEDTLHLSANMCPVHRSRVIEEIKRRLNERQNGSKRPLRVVSTQLVEAGVDIDFPVVMRELSGLDSIAQAAGRCNRNGLLPDLGKVMVFLLRDKLSNGYLQYCADVSLELIKSKPDLDILSPDAIKKYFGLLNEKINPDEHRINERLTPKKVEKYFDVSFKSAAREFKLIDDEGRIPLIVEYSEDINKTSQVYKLIDLLASDNPGLIRKAMRILQRYTIEVLPSVAEALKRQGVIIVKNGVLVLTAGYDIHMGLITPGDFIADSII